MDATGTRGSALPTIGRVALIALGTHVLLVSIVPLLELPVRERHERCLAGAA